MTLMSSSGSAKQTAVIDALERELTEMITALTEALKADVKCLPTDAIDAFSRSATLFRHRLLMQLQGTNSAMTARTVARQAADIPQFAGDFEQMRLQELQAKAKHWESRFQAIRACMTRIRTSEPQGLFPDDLPDDNLTKRLIERLSDVVLMLDFYANNQPQHPDMAEYGSYSDVRLSPVAFGEYVHAAYRIMLALRGERHIKFLDVGCGGGVKVLSAAHFFRRSDGIELDPGYADAARTLFDAFPQEGCRVFEEDALGSERYGEYDVIYFFQPMQDSEKLTALEDRIVEMARPGTLLIAPYPGFRERIEELNTASVAGRIYIKGWTQDEADTLRARAELIGPDTRARSLKTPWETVWQPLIDACLDRGYAP
ncbi:MAG: class I SAM-dependent methyltransferase [Pseudomonadota bacterium]